MNRMIAVALWSLLVAGLAPTVLADKPDRPVMELGVSGMTCDKCARAAQKALGKSKQVSKAEVDYETQRARLTLKEPIEREEVRKILAELGFEARFSDDPVFEPLTAEERAGLDLKVVSRGQAFDVKDHLVPGKVALFDYYADWCGPCRLLSPRLERLAFTYGDVVVRKVDISEWGSEAAEQATREFNLPGLPYVRVFGPDSKLLGAVQGNRVAQVEDLVLKGLGR